MPRSFRHVLVAPAALPVCLLVLGVCRPAAAQPAGEPFGGGRQFRLSVARGERPGFTALTPAAAGVTFTNSLPESRHLTNQILLNGAGVATGDVDGDGRCDVYFCNPDGRNALYRNLGDWRFAEITGTNGLTCAGLTATGAAFADLDGDGDLDLTVNTLGNGTRLFRNDGQGVFTPFGPPLNLGGAGMTVAIADVDGDGFLDLYVANYRLSALMDIPNARATFGRVDGKTVIETINGRPMTHPDFTNRFTVAANGSIEELGQVDVLFRNQGGTNFVPVPFTGGAFLDEAGQPLVQPLFEWGLTATFRDVNDDGRPDLYVCNDFHTPDRLWLNQGAGRFRLAPPFTFRKHSTFAMAADLADVNRDGFLDIFTLDMMSRDHTQRMRYMGEGGWPPQRPGRYDDQPQYGLNMLFLNRGDGTFADIAQLAGVEAGEWAWSCVFQDVDLDGWPDLLVVNGMERAARDMDVTAHLRQLRASRQLSDAEIFRERRAFPRLATANLAFRNRGDLTFAETGSAWGFDWQGVSQSMAQADFDNDGDLDLVINNLNAAPLLLRNDTAAPRVAVRLKGLPPNTHGIGARLRVTGGAVPLQIDEIIAGGRYLAGDEALRVFAAGTATNRLTIEVLWPGGRRSVLANAEPDWLYEFDEALAASPAPPAPAATEPPWFEDVSGKLDHRHHEDPFDDFTRQPLLPNKLSQAGPGVAWFDLNDDGWEDLVIAGGKGGTLGVFTNDTRGGFHPLTVPPLTAPVTRDQVTVLGWRRAPASPVILAAAANYEDGLALGAGVQQYDLADGHLDDSLPAAEASPGPMALADLDGDGDLDLFVGGRVIPGKYPAPASSRLFRNAAGRFVLEATNAPALSQVGLVSGATFSDLDGDGDPDLLLACEWGPLRLFRNEAGRLVAWNPVLIWPTSVDARTAPSATLAELTGWWTSVATGDFDGDGRPDIVAGNWGRNSKYQAHRDQPLQVRFGDLGGDGITDVIEAHFDTGLGKVVPERQLDPLAKSLPSLRARYPTHRAFSTASIEDMLGDQASSARQLTARHLESTVFLNRGDHFEARVLPVEAQFAPVFGIVVGDLDGDGAEDLFLAQNFFATQPETARYDAGRGLVLRGDGRGGFTPVPGQRSGVAIYGEQRGAAGADFDGDGRLDLAVTQNGAETRLLRNATARPGLRVRLAGPPGNATGVGAAVRVKCDGKLGPLREIQAGSGYCSQSAATVVLATPEPPTLLWIRWPGGKVTETTIPSGSRTVLVDPSGQLRPTER